MGGGVIEEIQMPQKKTRSDMETAKLRGFGTKGRCRDSKKLLVLVLSNLIHIWDYRTKCELYPYNNRLYNPLDRPL